MNINSSLTAIPENVRGTWTSTRDKVLRQFNYINGYRYSLNLEITCNTVHLYLCILLAGDVATNPGPNRTSNSGNVEGLSVTYLNACSLNPGQTDIT